MVGAVGADNETESRIDYEADYGERMDWDSQFKGLVLSAFTYGYMSTQIIGGRLAEVYGVKKVQFGRVYEFVKCQICQVSNLSSIKFVKFQMCQVSNLSIAKCVNFQICHLSSMSSINFVNCQMCQMSNLSIINFVNEMPYPLQIFGLSLFLTAICTLLSPVVVKWNSIAFIVLRVFQVDLQSVKISLSKVG